MHTCFFSYAEEDKEVAHGLADALERHAIESWLYTRNSLPGAPFTDQIARALEHVRFVVVLVSKHSLASHTVKRELELAHQRQLPVVPVLHQVDAGLINKSQPGWSTIFGTAVYVETTRESVLSIAERISEFHASVTGEVPRPVPSSSHRKGPTHAWDSDGKDVDIKSLEEIVFRTDQINNFLDFEKTYFISANKGQGKTLLMRYKRARLTAEFMPEQRAGNRAPVYFIPEGQPYLDMMENIRSTLPKGVLEFLCELPNTKRMWSFALRWSAVSYCRHLDNDRQVAESSLKTLMGTSLGILTQNDLNPTQVFRHLLGLTVKQVNRVLDGFDAELGQLFFSIHSGVYTFIDRVDMAIELMPREAWINIQAGLIEAAWDVMNSHRHVKIYATIREEALVNYHSSSKSNLHSSILTLRYTVSQLQDMINQLSQYYEALPNYRTFVGIDEVTNTHCRVSENSFYYLHRHTVGRPRDLVIICHALSQCRQHLNEEEFRRIVNETSSKEVAGNVFSEMAIFLDCLRDGTQRQQLFSILPYNIFSRAEVEQICRQYNGVNGAGAEAYPIEYGMHPFCELYNCGLFGYVAAPNEHGRMVQRFKQPHDVMTTEQSCLPHASYYMLHPSLQSLIQQHRRLNYQPFLYVSIGHNYEWRPIFSPLLKLQKELRQGGQSGRAALSQVIISDVMKAVGDIMSSLNHNKAIDESHLRRIMEQMEARNQDDAYLAIDDFLTTSLKCEASGSLR